MVVAIAALMLVVAESRAAVLQYAEAFKALAAHHGQVTVYGAFSGRLQHGDGQVDEATYNVQLQNVLEPKDMRKRADILVICDRFETGYDNSAVTLLGIDRKMLVSKVNVYGQFVVFGFPCWVAKPWDRGGLGLGRLRVEMAQLLVR